MRGMDFVESFRIATRALTANKGRSVLTMLGVVIGVAAVILLVAIGTGVQKEVTSQIEGLGSNLLFVFPGQLRAGSSAGGPGSVTRKFKLEDADLIRARVEGASAVVPIIQGPVTLKAENRTLRSTTAAATEDASQVFTSSIIGGRHYRRSEVVSGSRVVAIASTVRAELFPNVDPVGKTMNVNGQRFTVIGYYEPQGGGFGGDQDNRIYIPVTTAQRLFGTNDLSYIVVKVASPENVDAVRAQISRLMKPRYGEEFSVFSQEQTLGILSTLLGTLTVMLAGIAGISLLVGGIGIMNIMLVSVSERTREIGIRKAVGARTYDILSQFVLEAVMLSVLGGTVGILVGTGGAAALRQVVPTLVSWWSVAIAFAFAAAVGVFFGVYPAWRASQLDPITALRYE
jgi:putative ABC transport system permease protein